VVTEKLKSQSEVGRIPIELVLHWILLIELNPDLPLRKIQIVLGDTFKNMCAGTNQIFPSWQHERILTVHDFPETAPDGYQDVSEMGEQISAESSAPSQPQFFAALTTQQLFELSQWTLL
jgi:hypothetical protein